MLIADKSCPWQGMGKYSSALAATIRCVLKSHLIKHSSVQETCSMFRRNSKMAHEGHWGCCIGSGLSEGSEQRRMIHKMEKVICLQTWYEKKAGSPPGAMLHFSL